MQDSLEFTGSMFLEFINEFAQEFSESKVSRTNPSVVCVTPYRLCVTRDVEIPSEIKSEIKNTDANGRRLTRFERRVDGTPLSSSNEKLRPVRILINEEGHDEPQAYWFWVPKSELLQGATVKACLGWSERKVEPVAGETFATISDEGLAQWICYHQRLHALPFDDNLSERKVPDGPEAGRGEKVEYYRYLAADLAITQKVMGGHQIVASEPDEWEMTILRDAPAGGDNSEHTGRLAKK
jgi:hypothetical protein